MTHGADPNTHDHDRVSVLAHAAEGCHFEEGRGALYVLAQGADPCFDEGLWTPLMWTGMYGCVPLAEALIAAGADIHVVAKDGTTAGSMAKHYNRSTELIALLDRLGADSTAAPGKGTDGGSGRNVAG